MATEAIAAAAGAPAPEAAGGPLAVAVDVRSVPDAAGAAARVARSLERHLPARPAEVRCACWVGGEVQLVDGGKGPDPGSPAMPPISLLRGGVPGPQSALAPLLREVDGLAAAAAVLLGGETHDEAADWPRALLAPILDDGFDLVCPAYLRHPLDGALNTGIVYPLTRSLYGWRLRQPLGGEAALSAGFARRLLSDVDWRRDPAAAGSDVWLVAKALAGGARVCQAWMGDWPDPASEPDDASHAIERVLGLVFREMERYAERWQRVEGSRPVAESGIAGRPGAAPPRPNVERLHAAFRLGHKELEPIWAMAVAPANLIALRHAASLPEARFRLDDRLWARVVFDFAVGHFAKVMERGHLLRAMTPLYLGWVAGFAAETRDLDPAAAERRVEALAAAFEEEKAYLVARWRWPDTFSP